MNKTIIINLSLFFAILGLGGCTANLTEPEINFEPPSYVEQMPSREEKKDFTSRGSLFGQGDNPLFSDHKAMHVSDIVTVVISEIVKSSNKASRDLSSADSSLLGGGLFSTNNGVTAGTNGASGTGAGGGLAALVGGLNGVSNASFQSNSNSTFKGAGSATKNASFTTTVSARVVKILKNGNYFISGKREILIDDQKQIIQLSGVIRPYDIDQNNKINSNQMSDAKILYKTEGDVNRATKQGWGTKMVQAIWPF